MKWTQYADSLDLLEVISKVDCHHMIILIAINQTTHLCHCKSLKYFLQHAQVSAAIN